MAGLILPYLPMVVWQWDMLTASNQVTGFSFTPLLEMLRLLVLNHSRGFIPEPDLIWLTPIFFLFLAGLIFGIGELAGCRAATDDNDYDDDNSDDDEECCIAPWRRYTMIIVWLLAPIAFIHLMSIRQPIFTDRYLFWIAAPAMILMSLGAIVVWRHAGALLRYAAVALVVYVVGFWLYAGWQQKTLPMKYDLRSSVTYVDEHRSDDSLLILQIPHLHFAMRYYSSDFGPRPFTGSEERLGHWAEGLWTNNGWPDGDARALANEQMQDMVDGATDVWVVYSEVEMWDQRHLMQEWLNTHGALVDAQDYHGVQVREYRIDPQY